LRRSAIGRLSLTELDLAIGAWCYLDDDQLARLSPPTETA
jgi:hypothetical protein